MQKRKLRRIVEIRIKTIMLVPAILLAGISVSCSHDKPPIPEKKLIALLSDLEIVDAYSRQAHPSLAIPRDSLGLAVLKKHGFTPEQLDSTLGWYGRNVDLYYELYGKVEHELDRRMAHLSNRQTEIEEEGKRNIWAGSPQASLNDLNVSEGLSFSISAPEIRPGEIVEWRMHPTEGSVEMLLGVEYADGESSFSVSGMYMSDTSGMTLQTDTSRIVSRIFGLVRPLSLSRGQRILIDSISLDVLPMDSTRYFRINHQKKY